MLRYYLMMFIDWCCDAVIAMAALMGLLVIIGVFVRGLYAIFD